MVHLVTLVSLSFTSTKLVLLALRERHRCVITKVFDSARAENLMQEGRIEDIPENMGQHPMDTAHITPFLLNKFNDKPLATQRSCVMSLFYHLSIT